MRALWISLFAIVVLGLALGPAVFSKQKATDEELAIISPHWDGIRQEFGRAFSEYYYEKTQKTVRVVWLDTGSTAELLKYLGERYKQAALIGPNEGVGADILFGGGMDILPDMARQNFFETYPLSDEQKKMLPESAGGQQLRDPTNHYFAACLSTFGFVYNTKVVDYAKLKVPQQWSDLGDPSYQGWVSCGNPAQSGSLHMAFEIVLQGEGWDHGYGTVAKLMSNARAFNEGGTSVPRDVSLGQAAAGPCIDFYASAPIRRQGASHLQLVVPPGQGVATPDCIAILRNPPNKRAATEFLNFVLSEKGQKLWYVARGEKDGPKDYDLERLPVMPSLYEQNLKTYTVANPFKGSADFTYDGKKGSGRWSILNDLWRATVIDLHDELWDARTAAIKAGRDADLGAALCKAPLSEDALLAIGKARLPADKRNALRNKWSAWAREWYAAITKAAKENGPVPEFKAAPAE
jgi:iron(III) transport system substrate-binding protein